MRVLLLSNMYPSAGRPFGGTFITQRVKALEGLGHEVWPYGVRPVSVGLVAVASRARGRVTAEPVPTPPFEEYLLPIDVPRRLERRLDTSRLPASRSLMALVEQEGIDLVHGHGMYTFPAGSIARDVARATGVPYVVSVHGSDINVVMPPRRNSAYGEVFDGAGAVIAVSESLAAKVREVMTSPDNVHIVPNGYDPTIFYVDPNATKSGDRILYVGNLELVKGADRLPELQQQLDVLHPGLHWDVVGEGSLGPGLRANMPRAVFHSQVDPTEVARLMRRADVLVLPSREEGWGTVITEALACGTPTVAFDRGGISEAIGVSEHLVRPEAGVAGLAQMVVSTLAERWDRATLGRMAEGQSWDDVARGEEKAYRRALGDTA